MSMTKTFPTSTRTAVTVVLALAMMMPTMASAQTAEPVGQEPTATVAESGRESCSTEGASTDMELVRGQKAREWATAAAEAVKDGEIAVQAPLGALSHGGAKVYAVTSGDDTFTSVTIPVRGDYSMVSNLTVLYNEGGDVVEYAETLISENEDGNFNITSYMDGELVNSRDTDLPYMTDIELRNADLGSPMAEELNLAQGSGNTVACVAAVLGVSGFVAYLIVGACTGACGVPGVGTAVCVACIGAYATVGSASIAAVASCF